MTKTSARYSAEVRSRGGNINTNAGNIGTNASGIAANRNSIGSLQSSFTSLSSDVNEVREGVAVALAISPPDFVANETFGMKLSTGVYEGKSALALTAAGVLGTFAGGGRVSLDVGAGVGLDEGTVGGRAGVQLTW